MYGKICGGGVPIQIHGCPKRNTPNFSNRTKKGYQKIFAILNFMGLSDRIWEFLLGGVSDCDLPLVKVGSNTSIFKLRPRNNRAMRWIHLDEWSIDELINLEKNQWIFLAPCFSRDPNNPHRARQYILENSTILPFTSYSRIDRTLFSQLFKAEIHPDHHNLLDESAEYGQTKNLFAIKEVSPSARTNPRNELLALRLVNKAAHPHLIALLASYTQHDKLYLIFPWAECDLESFWKQKSPQDHPTILSWALRQFQGLASGLAAIHTFKVGSDDSIFSRSPVVDRFEDLDPMMVDGQDSEVEIFCRHGDIKPQNILWFPDSGDESGILKLIDFGSAEVKAAEAINRQSCVYTQTYRPPESYDFTLPREALVSTSYDIWSLGCVFLEFMVWLFCGYDGLVYFNTQRYFEDKSMDAYLQVGIAFFALFHDRTTGEPKADVKRSVAQICADLTGNGIGMPPMGCSAHMLNMLRVHPQYRELFRQILELIQKHMIILERPGVRSRMKAFQVAEALKGFHFMAEQLEGLDVLGRPSGQEASDTCFDPVWRY
ncbi:kinase-like domain-containing protein [Cercophora samala]|uniref:Kinase-like domain-containing protein n=1 Tax=Cercophora samala TaxID=330535 RepID=A0AA40D9E2_9PEZI|nr:kinase-like domain-containing protein [Cercophora samala]